MPIPPSVNHIYIHKRNGQVILSKTAENYIRKSRALINQAIEEQHWIKPHNSVWLYIDLVFFMPDRRIRDSHNCLKLLLDVMQGIVFHNDYYVMPRIQSVEYDKKNPRVIATINAQSTSNRERALKMASIYE